MKEDFYSMSDLLQKNNNMRNLNILFYLEIRLFVTFIDFTFFYKKQLYKKHEYEICQRLINTHTKETLAAWGFKFFKKHKKD